MIGPRKRIGMHRSENHAPAGGNPSPGRRGTATFCNAAYILSAALALALTAPAEHVHAQEIPGLLDDDVDKPGPPDGFDGPDSFNATGLTLTPPNVLARFPQAPLHRGPQPGHADLLRHFPKPGHQGRQGSCAGWAVAYARTYYRFWWLKKQGRSPTWGNVVSPAYIYDTSRRGWCNTGSSFPSNLRTLQRGAASWHQYPYSQSRCRRPASSLRQRVRGQFRIARFWRIDPRKIDQVKAQLAKGHPVLFAAHTDRAFQRLGKYRPYRGKRWWKNYLWSSGYPTVSERKVGHAMVLYGYWNGCGCFGIINSWGRRWANKGYAFISYDTFRKRVYSAWTIRPGGIGINQKIN